MKFSNLPGSNANTTGNGQPLKFRKLLSRGKDFEKSWEVYHVFPESREMAQSLTMHQRNYGISDFDYLAKFASLPFNQKFSPYMTQFGKPN